MSYFNKKVEILKDYGHAQHESHWRPNSFEKEGRDSMFKPVHEYMPNPPPARRLEKLSKNEKDPFVGMSTSMLSTPSPSVTLNRVNMMKNIGRSMSPRR